jgi:colicin import membrane protein
MPFRFTLTLSSEYEHNVGKLLAEKKERLDQLRKDPNASPSEISMLSLEVESLQSLFENYNLGMNVFRRAQGGRAGLRE